MATRGARVLSCSALAAGVLVIAGAAPASADCKSDGTQLGDLTTGICKGLENTRKGIEDTAKRITDGGQDRQSGGSSGGDSGGDSGGSSGGSDGSGGSSGSSEDDSGSSAKGGSGSGGGRTAGKTAQRGGPAQVTTGTRLRPPPLLNDPDAPGRAQKPVSSDKVVLPEVAGDQEPIPAPKNAPMSQAQSAAPDEPIGRPVMVALSLAGIALIGNITVQVWLRRRTS